MRVTANCVRACVVGRRVCVRAGVDRVRQQGRRLQGRLFPRSRRSPTRRGNRRWITSSQARSTALTTVSAATNSMTVIDYRPIEQQGIDRAKDVRGRQPAVPPRMPASWGPATGSMTSAAHSCTPRSSCLQRDAKLTSLAWEWGRHGRGQTSSRSPTTRISRARFAYVRDGARTSCTILEGTGCGRAMPEARPLPAVDRMGRQGRQRRPLPETSSTPTRITAWVSIPRRRRGARVVRPRGAGAGGRWSRCWRWSRVQRVQGGQGNGR